jgi:cell division protein FtsL
MRIVFKAHTKMTTFEHRELKGITIKNIVVTIISTASIVISVMTTYFQLKGDIRDVRIQQDAQNRINEIRLKVLEGQVALLQQEVEQIKIKRY